MPTPSCSALTFTRLSIALVAAVAAIAATARAQAVADPSHSELARPVVAVTIAQVPR